MTLRDPGLRTRTMIIDKKGVIRYGAFHISSEDAARLIEKLKTENDNTSSARHLIDGLRA